MTTTSTPASAPVSNRVSHSRSVVVAIGLLVFAAILPLAVPLGFGTVATTLGLEDGLLVVAAGGMLATLSLGVLAFVYLGFHPMSIPVRLPSRREYTWIVAGVVLSIGIAIVFALLEGLVGTGEATSSSAAALADAPLVVYGLVVVWALVATGPIEELLFRGVIQGRLRENFGPVAAIGITSVGFAVGHLPSYWFGGGGVFSAAVGLALVQISLGSIVLGAIYERTGNVTVVAVAHGVTNAILYGLLLAFAL